MNTIKRFFFFFYKTIRLNVGKNVLYVSNRSYFLILLFLDNKTILYVSNCSYFLILLCLDKPISE
jgi:hypothetical protein